MSKSQIIDHTADIGLRVVAATPAEAFATLTEDMFGIMVARETVAEKERWEESVEARSWEDLVVAWLDELLYRYESERLIAKTCRVTEISSTAIAAELFGDYLDPEVHETGVQIKAVTYHQLHAAETEEGFEVQVIFDI